MYLHAKHWVAQDQAFIPHKPGWGLLQNNRKQPSDLSLMEWDSLAPSANHGRQKRSWVQGKRRAGIQYFLTVHPPLSHWWTSGEDTETCTDPAAWHCLDVPSHSAMQCVCRCETRVEDVFAGSQAQFSFPMCFHFSPSFLPLKAFPVVDQNTWSSAALDISTLMPWGSCLEVRLCFKQPFTDSPAANSITHHAGMSELAEWVTCMSRRETLVLLSTRSVAPAGSALQLSYNLVLLPHLPFPSNYFWTNGKPVVWLCD